MAAEVPHRPEDRRRVEIVHESLLTNWPRLVRWQAQDAEGAQLRDELRQAARLWEEHGRSEDRLWTGTAFRELQLWRERYPGGLTALEGAFATATTALALRKRRRRRVAITAAFALLSAGFAYVTVLRQQAVGEKRRAEQAVLRSEAQRLVTLGRLELERDPTAALAYATKSLDLTDTVEARRFALEAFWLGPIASVLPVSGWQGCLGVKFSPDGRSLAVLSISGVDLLVSQEGGEPRKLDKPRSTSCPPTARFSADGRYLVADAAERELWILSVPQGERLRTLPLDGSDFLDVRGSDIWTLSREPDEPRGAIEHSVRASPLAGGAATAIARLPAESPLRSLELDAGGSWLALLREGGVYRKRLSGGAGAPEELLWSLDEEMSILRLAPGGDRVALFGPRGAQVRSLRDGTLRRFPIPKGLSPQGWLPPRLDTTGSRLAWGATSGAAWVWDVDAPEEIAPLFLRSATTVVHDAAFHPGGALLATADWRGVSFWALDRPFARDFAALESNVRRLLFSPDSRWLAACTSLDSAWLLPLDASAGAARRLPGNKCHGLAIDPVRGQIVWGASSEGVFLAPLAGGAVKGLPGAAEAAMSGLPVGMAFDAEGRRAAAILWTLDEASARYLHLWDLDRNDSQVFPLGVGRGVEIPDQRFAPDGTLWSAGPGGILRRDLESGTARAVYGEGAEHALMDLSSDGRWLLAAVGSVPEVGTLNGELLVLDLVAGGSRRILSHGSRFSAIAMDATGRIVVTMDPEGVVRVGAVTGEEPHLLISQQRGRAMELSPDGRWIASASGAEIRLWPMPDLTKPPLHTLPYDDLLTKLRSLTNLRVVADATSPTGYKLDVGPFPGWETVPEW